MQVSSINQDVSTKASSAAQPRDQGASSNEQNRCSSELAGQIEAVEKKTKQQKRNVVPSTMSGESMCTRRQADLGTAPKAVDLRHSRQQWSKAEECGPLSMHAQESSHTECTMPSQMKYQAGELIGDYILYRF